MLKHILTAAVATGALLAGSAAFAQDYDHDRNQRQHYSDRTDHRDRSGDRNSSRDRNWSGNHTTMGGGSYRNRDYNRSYYQNDRNNNSGYYHHQDYDRDHGYYGNRGYRSGYYGYRNYVDRDRIFYVIREHNYNYVGDPYWYGDAYVVRAYDPYGRLVLVRVDPYTGAWLGVMFRL
ncbi:MAG TPA: hypothetical protein VGT78_07190 [Rhizomicrobium sp.]|nr:hypothetical protein [Rhizomicrobium sp.]